MATAGRSYVRAKGGARAAVRSASAGRRSVSRVGAFLGAVAGTGINAALRTLDLTSFVGRSAEETIAAIVDALAPAGALVEDAAARVAVDETLGILYDRVVASGGDLTVLDALTPADVAEAIENCVAIYIYEQWVGELGLSIERGTISESAAVGLERSMRSYVRESVKLELGERDALAINWGGKDGRDLVAKVFQDAYSFLENNQ